MHDRAKLNTPGSCTVTPEEAKKIVAEQNAELEALENKVAQLAEANAGPVLLAIVRGLIEIVCAMQGQAFRTHNKIRFYRGVLAMLGKGIS
jgi:hypothetical protein